MSQRRRRLTPEQRRRIMKRRRMQRLKKRLIIIVPIAIALIVALILLLGGKKRDNVSPAEPALQIESTAETVIDEATDDAVDTVEATATAEADVQAASAPTAEPATDTQAASFDYDEAYVRAVKGEVTGPVITPDYANVDSDKLSRWPETAENAMPVLYKANTDENIIAVTVDDCYQGENLQKIVQCALDNSAQLTIFPIGENLTKQAIGDVVKWAWQNGMEIENHTYHHVGLYHYADDRMSEELWQQSQVLNSLLGVNYTEHFFRPHGGDERDDQRIQAFSQQLGYSGIAIWSQDGSKSSIDQLYSSLAPGEIYLFHTTDNDLSLLLKFIPAAVQRGYRLVTLNEMFGLPENETSELTALTKPTFEAFKVETRSLKKTTYARAAAPVQARLIELGWMEGEPTGVYGDTTYTAVMYFQRAAGLDTDGICGAETQKLLFSDSAPTASDAEKAEIKERLQKIEESKNQN